MEVESTAIENGPTVHEEEEEEELPDLDDLTGSSTMAAISLREFKKEMDTCSPVPARNDPCSAECPDKSQPEVVTITLCDEDSIQCLGTQSQDLVILEEKLTKNSASDPLFDSEDADAELAQYLDDFEKKEASPKPPAEQEKPKLSGRLAKLMGKIPAGLLHKKPVIQSSKNSVIDFEEDPKAYDETQKGVEKLMKRFQIHASTAKPKKEEHYKIHITTKEEDSQGIEHLQTGEEDYVKVVPEEEADEMASPEMQAPGVKMGMARARLLAQVRANRAKAMEEKMKNYAMYSEEKDLDDKPENEEPDLLDENDDADAGSGDDTENEADEDEIDGEAEEPEGEDCGEEEEEADGEEDEIDDGDEVPVFNGKKQRKRIKFLEDEADESEGENGSADEDEAKLDKVRKSDLNFIDDTPLSDDEDMPNAYVHEPTESQLQEYENHQTVSEPDEAFSQDLFSESESQPQVQSGYSGVDSSPIPSSISSFLDPNKTPIFTPILSRKHNNSPFGSLKVNFKSSQPQISPLIPRLNSETALAAFCEDSPCENRSSPAMPAGLSKLIGETTPMTQRGIDDELEGICSARFPSQPPMTPCDSQENASFDFNSDDEKKTTSVKDRCNSRNSVVLNGSSVILDTPKTTERSGRGTRLNFDQVPATAVADNDSQADGSDDENEEVVTPSVRQRKRKRQLKFSDDEDSDAEGKDNEVESKSSDEEMVDDAASEEAMESEVEYDENEEPIMKPAIGLVDKKTGQLRREFFEAEAELSGSEAGSDDEDEKNMDYYEKEEGDEEDFDDDEIRKQVEKQYLKQQLDDDEREVRDLQNRYLEDGDLHLDGQMRERKFKWKLENKQWLQGVQVTDTDPTDEVEDETEVKWREAKLEKLRWMKENEKAVVADEDIEVVSQKLLRTSQVLKLGNTTLRKSKTEVTITEEVSSTEKSPAAFERKGSFLCRETTLTRLAETAKISDSINTTKPAGAKGFVFQVLTPPSDVANSKKSSARNKQEIKSQPKKMLRVDRSFSNLDEAEQSKSIFKFMS